jgi:heme oxygenase
MTVRTSTPPTSIEERIVMLPLPTIRSRMVGLQQETAACHERVERRVESAGLLDSVQSYSALISRLYGLYVPLEASLEQAIARFDLPIDSAARRKTTALRRDLRALGLTAATIDRLPRADRMPALACSEMALGCLYVVEGATLGGQVIARRLLQQLGIGPASGGAFFAGYGDDVRQRWLTFCSLLAEALQPPRAERLVTASAIETFRLFGDWLGAERAAA